jgi:HAD superfamily hydrolase (TIGR01490 family)
MVNPVAVFDLDSTLIEGDCELLWCEFMGHKGMVDASFLKTVEFYCVEYEEGRLDYVEFEKFILGPLTSLSSTAGQALVDEFLLGLQKLIRPYMLQIVEEHRTHGDVLLLATASNSILAQPVARLLGIPNLVCTWMKMVDGVPTGELAGGAPFREGKADQVKVWISENPVTLAESWGYSDSHNDLPILNLVAHPVAVTPDKVLRHYAQQNGWPIIEKQAAP